MTRGMPLRVLAATHLHHRRAAVRTAGRRRRGGVYSRMNALAVYRAWRMVPVVLIVRALPLTLLSPPYHNNAARL